MGGGGNNPQHLASSNTLFFFVSALSLSVLLSRPRPTPRRRALGSPKAATHPDDGVFIY
ncbi:uncharacterized protein BJX67DRAFT_358419 [Aspergillus lucknowensis]|uniref:Uncharacterized protein n=1 Tax=Aspergillus lucknowensis TaxID=176173 RepID=A0ABR4LMI7_9EURO